MPCVAILHLHPEWEYSTYNTMSGRIGKVVALHAEIAWSIPGWAEPAGGQGARVSACAGLTNQLLSCWVDPRIVWKKTLSQQL